MVEGNRTQGNPPKTELTQVTRSGQKLHGQTRISECVKYKIPRRTQLRQKQTILTEQ